jgi:O-antigen biosynthesis protein
VKDRFIYHYRRTRSLLQRGLRSLRVRGLKASLAMLSPRLKQARADSALRFPTPAEIESLNAANFHSERPEVSLIIPVHNQLTLTQSCLTSLQLQRSEISFEVIVVDDASSDGSFEFLSGIQGLRLVRMLEQSGYVFASNKGAEQARGEILVFLNNDTVVQAGWLDELLKVFNKFPNTGIVGAKLLYPNGRLQEAGGTIFNDGSVWNMGRFEQADNPGFNYIREVDYVSGAALAIRKNVFHQMKGFDPHFAPGYFEDTDLSMRVRQSGLKIRYQPFAKVVHFEGATSGTHLNEGMKAFQTPHQIKFARRWQKELTEYPARPATEKENTALEKSSGAR